MRFTTPADHCTKDANKLILAVDAMRVLLEAGGQADFDGLPLRVKARVLEIIENRLPLWPNLSGAKPLRHQ
jgi:hypothetical protein